MPMGTLILFVLVGTFTPGPNNITSMNTARRLGFWRTRPLILGIGSGFFVVALSCALFNLALKEIMPGIQPILGGLGAFYMLWLAFKPFFHSKKKAASASDDGHLYAAGLLLQFLNPKVILYSLATMSGFVLPYVSDLLPILLISLILALLAMLSVTSWALFGVAFQRYFSKYESVVNVIMAILLVYCAVTISGLDVKALFSPN
ncbi:MAG: LysE family transporter [Synergistaceae bacterium]|jgi:threonine/homoserine/homoserine lactone efflux protein|nr:LysE family transporter [Synergistaceae bacterium]